MKPAREKMMDFLARRDHSELELRQKLSKTYSSEEIEKALAEGRERGWLLEPAQLAERAARALHRKEKGIRYIQNFLKKKGLPIVETDPEIELNKALALVSKKFKKDTGFEWEEQGKIYRFLATRGFDQDTIRKVIHERR